MQTGGFLHLTLLRKIANKSSVRDYRQKWGQKKRGRKTIDLEGNIEQGNIHQENKINTQVGIYNKPEQKSNIFIKMKDEHYALTGWSIDWEKENNHQLEQISRDKSPQIILKRNLLIQNANNEQKTILGQKSLTQIKRNHLNNDLQLKSHKKLSMNILLKKKKETKKQRAEKRLSGAKAININYSDIQIDNRKQNLKYPLPLTKDLSLNRQKIKDIQKKSSYNTFVSQLKLQSKIKNLLK